MARGTPVNVTVSKGQQALLLPDLVGRSLDDARRMLQDLGVTLREVTQTPRDDVSAGQVIAMNPAAGTSIAHGDAVSVTIAVQPAGGAGGAAPPQPIVTGTQPQPIVTGTPPQPIVTGAPPGPQSVPTADRQTELRIIVPEGPANQLVRIVVIDQLGVHTVYQAAQHPGDIIKRTVAGQGYTIVQVYIDSKLIQEIRP